MGAKRGRKTKGRRKSSGRAGERRRTGRTRRRRRRVREHVTSLAPQAQPACKPGPGCSTTWSLRLFTYSSCILLPHLPDVVLDASENSCPQMYPAAK